MSNDMYILCDGCYLMYYRYEGEKKKQKTIIYNHQEEVVAEIDGVKTHKEIVDYLLKEES